MRELPGRALRILLIGSGGCTALSLLAHAEVAHVQVVDPNPAQLHLIELRRCALAHLELEDQLLLIGAFGAPGSRQRLELYESLAPHLPPETRAFWDAHPLEVSSGVNRSGRFEETFRELARAFATRGLEPRVALGSAAWSEVFEEVFERGRLIETFGPDAVNYSMDRSFGAHFADVFARALSEGPVEENYHQHQVWRDRYASPAQVPTYLKPQRQAQIRRLGLGRLALDHGSFGDRLETLAGSGPFDLIQISNISDWMPIFELRALLTRARACLTAHGVVLGRRLNGDHVLAELFAEVFDSHAGFNAELLGLERSRFYREVVAGFRAAPNLAP